MCGNYSRPGNSLTERFPLTVEALLRLPRAPRAARRMQSHTRLCPGEDCARPASQRAYRDGRADRGRSRLQDRAGKHRVESEGLALSQTHDWLKMKNPIWPAVKPEAEEDWECEVIGFH